MIIRKPAVPLSELPKPQRTVPLLELAKNQSNEPSGLIRQRSERPLKKVAQQTKFSTVSAPAISERSIKSQSNKKVSNTRLSREKHIKSGIPRKSLSECQDDIFSTNISLSDSTNSSKTGTVTVLNELEGKSEIASNKTVVHNTVTTAITPINEVAANDNKYETTPTPENINTLPSQGVLLPNENSNLTSCQTIKTKVKVDRLTTTSDIPPHRHEEVIKAATDMCTADKNVLHFRKQQNKHGSRYNHNYKIYDGKKILGLLSLEPRQRTVRFMRLDFNPSKIGSAACKIVAEALRSIIGVNAADIISQSNITRFDIAIDLYNIDINDMFYFSSRPIHSSTWGKMFKNGEEFKYRIESQYLGSIESDLYFAVYDKRAERIANGEGKDVPHKAITRVEARVAPRIANGNSKKSLQLNNLELMTNPFSALSITSIPVPDGDDGQFALFVYAAQHVGAQTALAVIKDSRKRSEYRKHLLGQAVNCWKPEEYWERAIIALRKALASLC